jgi:hypothetical protein
MSDNQENFAERKCIHIIEESRVIRNLSFCNKCGIFEYEKVSYINNSENLEK